VIYLSLKYERSLMDVTYAQTYFVSLTIIYPLTGIRRIILLIP